MLAGAILRFVVMADDLMALIAAAQQNVAAAQLARQNEGSDASDDGDDNDSASDDSNASSYDSINQPPPGALNICQKGAQRQSSRHQHRPLAALKRNSFKTTLSCHSAHAIFFSS